MAGVGGTAGASEAGLELGVWFTLVRLVETVLIMPIIRVEILPGRSVEQKRELVEVLTRETARIAGCSEQSIYVVIEDVRKENWGVGGELCFDKFPD